MKNSKKLVKKDLKKVTGGKKQREIKILDPETNFVVNIAEKVCKGNKKLPRI